MRRQAKAKNFCRTTLYLHRGYSIPFRVCLFWTIFWPNEKDLFLKFLYHEVKKIPYKITTFFTMQAIAKTSFVSHSFYAGNTPCRVWFHLDNSMTQSKRTLFKIPFSRNSKNSVWNAYKTLTTFVAKLQNKFIFLHSTCTGNTPYKVWFNLDNLFIQSKKNYSYNSPIAKFSNFRMETHLFC